MGKLFGTDGIRGVANTVLTPELALATGRALVTVLREQGLGRPAVLVGRDPRWSGELLESALVAGIASAGGDAVTVGVIPTPGVAYLAATSDVAAGVVISASHNPVEDNGLKIFGGDGFKLTDSEDARLEELLQAAAGGNAPLPGPRPTGTDVGRIVEDPALVERYVEHLVTAAAVELHGLRVVVDAANGATSQIAPLVYQRLHAEVTALHGLPDGANINAGVGSTHPKVIAAAVLERGADVGLAHDGDGDRLIAAAADGSEVDGDVTLAILAVERKRSGSLLGNTVVTTVMTNLGFKQAMHRHGVKVLETRVGDRYVLEAMRAHGAVLGGEQSGHIIQLDQATTGDGILTAVRLLSIVAASGAALRELAGVMSRLPQLLVNVRVADRSRLDGCEEVWSAVRREEAALAGEGRVLVRASGTEPLVRVMVEAPTEQDAASTAERIAKVVREALT